MDFKADAKTLKTAGFVPVYVASLIGALTSLCSFFTVKYKHLIGIDEGLDIFAIHGIGGFVGDILTGFFASRAIPALDGVSNAYEGGWWDHNWKQMGYQLAAATTCAAWSFVVSIVLLFIIDRIPGCHLRASEEDEIRGLDFKYLNDCIDVEGDTMVLYGAGAATPGMTTSGIVGGVGGTASSGAGSDRMGESVGPEKRD
jgi:Amt family ammonium transporter